jgi:xanthosine utilization system XapX-like protein
MLITLPKLLLPMIIYALGYYLVSPMTGLALVALTGILGFALRNKVFTWIEKIYKAEKYKTLDAYKQKA